MDATITIRTQKTVKLAAQARAKKLGLNLSDIINNQLRRFAKGDDVVFEDNYSEEEIANLLRASREADEEYARGKMKSYTPDEFIAMLKDVSSGKIKVNDDGSIRED